MKQQPGCTNPAHSGGFGNYCGQACSPPAKKSDVPGASGAEDGQGACTPLTDDEFLDRHAKHFASTGNLYLPESQGGKAGNPDVHFCMPPAAVKVKNVVIACEYSATVRDAFQAAGHNAISVDLLPSEKPGAHYQGDIFEFLEGSSVKWDLLIGHPPCTDLSLSGARWATDHWVKRKNKPSRWHDGSAKRLARDSALQFFARLWALPIEQIVLEQPMSMAVRVAKKSQTIHPWQFGHGEVKTTWLWLKNLPALVPSDVVSGRNSIVHSMPPGPDRWKDRSRTYPGIAAAMAAQWGSV